MAYTRMTGDRAGALSGGCEFRDRSRAQAWPVGTSNDDDDVSSDDFEAHAPAKLNEVIVADRPLHRSVVERWRSRRTARWLSPPIQIATMARRMRSGWRARAASWCRSRRAASPCARVASLRSTLRDLVVTPAGERFVSSYRSAELLLIDADGSIAARSKPPSVSAFRDEVSLPDVAATDADDEVLGENIPKGPPFQPREVTMSSMPRRRDAQQRSDGGRGHRRNAASPLATRLGAARAIHARRLRRHAGAALRSELRRRSSRRHQLADGGPTWRARRVSRDAVVAGKRDGRRAHQTRGALIERVYFPGAAFVLAAGLALVALASLRAQLRGQTGG